MLEVHQAPEQHQVTVQRGNIYLSREVCDTYFRDIQTVALICRDGQLLMIPLIRASGGGLLLKVRNSRGDRVVHAQEFLRERGLAEDFVEHLLPVRWLSEQAALQLEGLPLNGAAV